METSGKENQRLVMCSAPLSPPLIALFPVIFQSLESLRVEQASWGRQGRASVHPLGFLLLRIGSAQLQLPGPADLAPHRAWGIQGCGRGVDGDEDEEAQNQKG